MNFSQQSANESAIEEDLGLIGASADDTEAELIRKICETELLAGSEHFMAYVFLTHIKADTSPSAAFGFSFVY